STKEELRRSSTRYTRLEAEAKKAGGGLRKSVLRAQNKVHAPLPRHMALIFPSHPLQATRNHKPNTHGVLIVRRNSSSIPKSSSRTRSHVSRPIIISTNYVNRLTSCLMATY